MSKKKKKNDLDFFMKMDRRRFIRDFGLAASIAAPFLRSSVAMGQSAAAPTRLMFIPLQHGWGYDRDIATFTGSENNFTIPAPLNMLESIRDHCTFVDGVRTSYWGNAHDVSYSDILTCSVPHDAPANRSRYGGPFPDPTMPSIDYLVGQAVNKEVLRFSANYDSWGASYHPMSFDNTLRPLPYFSNPLSAYQNIIDPLRQLQNPQANQSRELVRNALLDQVGSDADRMLRKLSDSSQRSKMEGYITALNNLGNNLINTGNNVDINSITLPNAPVQNPAFTDSIDAYLEMIRISFMLDTHRVAVMGFGQGVNNWNWRDPNNNLRMGNTFGNDFHQDVAHYGRAPTYLPDPERAAAMGGWTTWYANKVINFVNALRNTTDIDGRPMIDNTLIVLLGEVGNGNHDRRDITYVLIGGGGQGRLRGNRWIRTEKVEPRNRQGYFWGSLDVNGNQVTSGINYGDPVSYHHASDLMVSIARLAGYNTDSFGLAPYNLNPINLL